MEHFALMDIPDDPSTATTWLEPVDDDTYLSGRGSSWTGNDVTVEPGFRRVVNPEHPGSSRR